MAENDAFAPSIGTLRTVDRLTKELSQSAAQFGRTLTSALAQGIIEGKRLEDVLRGVGKSMTESLLKSALAPAQGMLSSLISSGANSLLNVVRGGVGLGALGASVRPFADGGVIASPAYFPLGRDLGLMGERGAEAIMPLSRGPDGKLGVRAGGGEGGRPLSVTVQVTTPDADSFRRSEAQVSAAIARAVARGSRAL
ncbi:phage tail tape measure protein [Bosea caraganae]|uniref:Phage tail tape measure protein n=1 Tax=Bosea caraganae TaxID=2763117 RepID=A0A370L3L2_9HYPH|nr:phage tail tape measure protein [Bosea caraganae]RDJ22991.1 phage tail tape measure protein [Bosea caraganae]RDJ28771.1 phage tail tape measure protein [Bosea caraganae]